MTSPPVESEAMSLLSSAAFQLAALASELTSDRNLLTEFLSLQVSHRTRETYAKSIDDFFNCLLGQKATTELVGQFLLFSQPQAVADWRGVGDHRRSHRRRGGVARQKR